MRIDIKRYRPFKNWRKRLLIWIPLIVLGLLIDEYAKEGYVFDPRDIPIPFTHENIIVTLLIFYIILIFLNLKH